MYKCYIILSAYVELAEIEIQSDVFASHQPAVSGMAKNIP